MMNWGRRGRRVVICRSDQTGTVRVLLPEASSRCAVTLKITDGNQDVRSPMQARKGARGETDPLVTTSR